MLSILHRRTAATRQILAQFCPITTVASRQAELINWVKENSGSVSSTISISYPNAVTGAGLQAAQACKAGESLVHLPAQCQLTYGDKTSPELMSLIDKVPKELWGAKLALQLLRERCLGTKSFFKHYISNLPVGVPGIPLFFSQDAIKALEEYPPLSQQVKRRCRWLVSFADGELAQAPSSPRDPFDGQQIDPNTLGWALAMTTSRAFKVQGPDKAAAQLPLIDMCNHSFAPNCQVFPGKEGSVDLVASRDITASESLLLSYGNIDNDFLLLDYGFLVPSNPFDAVAVRFDFAFFQAANALSKQKLDDDAIDSLEDFQEKLLSELKLSGPEEDRELMLRRSLPSCSPRAVAAARILSAQNDAELAGRSAESLGRWKAPVSPINEALRMIAGVAFFVLSRFPATLEQDKQLLAGHSKGPLPEDMALAVQFRLGKKQLMAELLHDLANRIKDLAMQPLQDSASPPQQSSDIGKRSYSTCTAWATKMKSASRRANDNSNGFG